MNVPCICQSQKYSFYTPLYKMFPVSANHKSILSTHLYTKCSLYLPIKKVFFLHTFYIKCSPVFANHKSILSTHLYTKCSLYLPITKVFFLHTFIQNVPCICQSQKYSFYTPLYKMFPVSVNHKSILSTHLLYKMFPVSVNHKSILSTHLYTKCSLYLSITKVFLLHTFIQNVPCICQSQKYSFYTPLYKMFPVSANHKSILSTHLYTKCSLYLSITKVFFLHTFIQNVPCICQSQKYSYYTTLYKMFPVSVNHKSILSTHLYTKCSLYLPITKVFFLHTFIQNVPCICQLQKHSFYTPFIQNVPCICQSQKYSFYTLLYKMFPCICQLKKYSFYTPFI